MYVSSEQRLLLFTTPYRSQRLYLQVYGHRNDTPPHSSGNSSLVSSNSASSDVLINRHLSVEGEGPLFITGPSDRGRLALLLGNDGDIPRPLAPQQGPMDLSLVVSLEIGETSLPADYKHLQSPAPALPKTRIAAALTAGSQLGNNYSSVLNDSHVGNFNIIGTNSSSGSNHGGGGAGRQSQRIACQYTVDLRVTRHLTPKGDGSDAQLAVAAEDVEFSCFCPHCIALVSCLFRSLSQLAGGLAVAADCGAAQMTLAASTFHTEVGTASSSPLSIYALVHC